MKNPLSNLRKHITWLNPPCAKRKHGQQNKVLWLAGLGLSAAIVSFPSHSDPCIGDLNGTKFGFQATAHSQAPLSNTLGTLPSVNGTNCTDGVSFGPGVQSCNRNSIAGSRRYLTAVFVSVGANIAGAGCDFDCGVRTCRVEGASGLPVELLEMEIQ